MGSLLPAAAAYNVGTSVVLLLLPCKKASRLICEPQQLQVKAQNYRDRQQAAGRSISDMMERNLRVRIEEAKIKERLERCLVAEQGWNYTTTSSHDHFKTKNRNNIEIMRMVGATFGLTILSCTSCLCLASLVLHLIMNTSYLAT